MHVSSALYCPRCHILERGRANDGIDSGRERRCGVERHLIFKSKTIVGFNEIYVRSLLQEA